MSRIERTQMQAPAYLRNTYTDNPIQEQENNPHRRQEIDNKNTQTGAMTNK